MPVKSKVLVVEDEKSISNFIVAILNANNYDVVTARTGQEAYSLITSCCPDVVILDLTCMPGIRRAGHFTIQRNGSGQSAECWIWTAWMC